MSGAKTPLSNAFLQNNMDAKGYKILNLDLSDLASGVPFVDSTPIIRGSVDPTKLLRFEVDGFTTGTTRRLTPPNYDGDIATLAGTENLTNKTLNGMTFAGTGGFSLTNAIVAFQGSVIVGTSNADDIRIGAAGGSANVTLPPSGTLATVADTQPHSTNLDTFAAIVSTSTGRNILTLTNPTDAGYLHVNNDLDHTVSTKTPAQLLADLGISESDAPFIPLSYLSTDSTLKPYSDDLIASQRAVYLYLNPRVGGGIKPVSDDSIVSSGSIDLNDLGPQIDVTDSNDISTVVLDEGEERVLHFTTALNLKYSESLLLPGKADILTEPGDYAVLQGGADGVVTVTRYQKASVQSVVADIDGGTIQHVNISNSTLGLRSFGTEFDCQISLEDTYTSGHILHLYTGDSDRLLSLGGNLALSGALATAGDADLTFNLTGTSVVTLPETGTLVTLDGVEDLTNKTLNGLTFGGTGGLVLNDCIISFAGTLVIEGDLSILGGSALRFDVVGDTILTLPTAGTLVAKVGVPATATSTGIEGQVSYDATHFYQCISTNTWVRCTLASW